MAAMTRLRFAAMALGGAVGLLTLTAAQPPAGLAVAKGGLWEITGLPGAKGSERQCVADTVALAQFEHRGKSCSHKVLSDSGSSVLIEYSCGGAGFGRSKVDVITPRSLRIDTQGISDDLPFGYVLQARRVGDCPSGSTASRH